MIEVAGLTKQYRVHERDPGLAAGLRALFKRRYRTVDAVVDLDFTIAPGERVGFLGFFCACVPSANDKSAAANAGNAHERRHVLEMRLPSPRSSRDAASSHHQFA